MTALQWISSGEVSSAHVNHKEWALLCDWVYYTHANSCHPSYVQVCQVQLIDSGGIYKKTCVSCCYMASNSNLQIPSLHTLILNISYSFFFHIRLLVIWNNTIMIFLKQKNNIKIKNCLKSDLIIVFTNRNVNTNNAWTDGPFVTSGGFIWILNLPDCTYVLNSSIS